MKKLLMVLVFSSVIMFSYGQNSKINSVLSTGYWYKMAVSETGFHKLTYDDLTIMGFDLSTLDPAHIRIYGNGGGMLSMLIDEPRYDDLMETAIRVTGEEDGIFDPEDYVLFYAQGAVVWKYNEPEDVFEHQINYYDDFAYYFITTDLGPGKRFEDQLSIEDPPTQYVTTFNDYQFHEVDEHNLIQSGREWYGEVFDSTLSYNFYFRFPNIDIESSVDIRTSVLARSEVESSFDLYANNELVENIPISSISPNTLSAYARDVVSDAQFDTTDEDLFITTTYNKTHVRGIGWLDYIAINTRRALLKSDPQMDFRDVESVGQGNITRFTISGVVPEEMVMEITDPINVVKQLPLAGDNPTDFEFVLETNLLREFVILKEAELFVPELIGPVENQNLHGLLGADMIIVTHPALLDAAHELADFHTTHDGMNVVVAETNQIYNEFSSGAQDITAIRDFVKMIYDYGKERNDPLQYLLLFGDASYDYKERINNNTNLVPVYQSIESLLPISSYISDDFFGCLEEGEGNWNTGFAQESIDISIGRIPASNDTDAMNVVDKIIQYVNNPDTYHNWRNRISYVADDEDSNIHMSMADDLTEIAFSEDLNINIEKIYFDFYPQVSTPDGDRYPHAQEALNETVQNGAMIINYSGHGSDTMWAHEQVLTPEVINSWVNINNLPLFITGACSFGPFDNPDIISGAEQILLKENGGGVGVISSSRPNFASPGHAFSKAFYEYLFSAENPDNLAIGDIYRNAKNSSLNNSTAKMSLLGDPAVKLPVPQNRVITTHINGIEVGEPLDTIPPAGNIVINGYIANEDGFLLQDFNGELELSFYDKIREKYTRNNDGSGVFYFNIQDSVLFEGIFTVINGVFEVSFTLPPEMDQDFGYSKISYYAADYPVDAAGYFKDLVIGGISSGFDDHLATKGELKIYPTVTDGPVYIDLSDIDVNNAAIVIYDINGKLLLNNRIDNESGINKFTLDLSGLPKGMHFVRLITEKNEYHAKVVVL